VKIESLVSDASDKGSPRRRLSSDQVNAIATIFWNGDISSSVMQLIDQGVTATILHMRRQTHAIGSH
jgi:hypothetical protein